MESKKVEVENKTKAEIITYLIVGVLTTIVSLVVYYALVACILDPSDAIQLQIANMISWLAAVTFAYFTNRKYVFESKNEHIVLEAMKFYLSRLGTLLLDMTIMYIGVSLLFYNDKFVKIIVQIIVIIVNYIFSKLFVFQKPQY